MEELAGLEYGVITEGVVRSMFGLLGPALNKFISSKTGLTKEEADMATSSITLFSTPSHVDLYLSDLRLYMEACMAAEKSGIQVQFLVTDDHAFLRISSSRGWPRRYYETKLRLFLGSGRVSRSSWLVK